MFQVMSDFPTHTQAHDTDDHAQDSPVQPAEKPAARASVPAAKAPAGMDRRAARGFARRVLATRSALAGLDAGDVEILARISGERKTVRGDLDELAVVLSTAEDSGAGSALASTRDLLGMDDPMDAVVEATMLAADQPDTFREVFSLTRDLGVHDLARTPAGHEVKAARALVQALRDADTTDISARLDRLVELLG